MKTYAEAQGAPPFDWNRFLALPSATEEQWGKASNLAANWVTCACGNQCDVIPRNEYGTPKDHYLRRWGHLFAEAIDNYRIEEAKVLLAKIEKRSALLIAEIAKND